MPYDYQGHKVYWLGEEECGFPKQSVQSFKEIQTKCIEDGTLWEDPWFLPNHTSISLISSHDSVIKHSVTEWKRPKDFVTNPCFIHEGIHKWDARQGHLSNCWFVAAMSGLTLLPKRYFQMVVPHGQDFADNYAGIFHFRFWQYGRWVDVAVDDRLPVGYYTLAFADSSSKNEFWSALLEKAYAKLHGSYEALEWGAPMESMEDLTGGVTEFYDFKKPIPKNLFKLIYRAFELKSMMILSTKDTKTPKKLKGLRPSHAYLVLNVEYVMTAEGATPVLQLRNPYGDRTVSEWTGAWSDHSEEWKKVDEKEKERLALKEQSDGEFWMCWEDVTQCFLSVEVCSVDVGCPTPAELPSCVKRRWYLTEREGEWVRWHTAGGSYNLVPDFFHKNPQFRFKIEEADGDNSIRLVDDTEKKCTVIISLVQNRRRLQRLRSRKFWEIGFSIYKLKGNDVTSDQLDSRFFKSNMADVETYNGDSQFREETKRISLSAGEYCIVTSTFYPHQGCEFLLRILSRKPIVVIDPDETYLRKSKMTRKENKCLFLEFVGDVKGDMDWKILKSLIDSKLGKSEQMNGQAKGGGGKRKRSLEDKPSVITTDDMFSMELCRSLIALYDHNHSGRISLDEFHDLWIDVLHWTDVFKSHNKENTGFLARTELGTALRSAGFELSEHIIEIMAIRYGGWDGLVSFSDFLVCATRMMNSIETFNGIHENKNEKITMKRDDYLENMLYP